MATLPIPQGVYRSFRSISPKALAQQHIRLVLVDLDNTLVAYKEPLPTPQVVAWKNALEAEGISLFILSNSRKKGRVEEFAKELDVPYRTWSGKPKKKGYRAALREMGAIPEQTVMVGDQIFTDVFGARRMGITALLVQPIRFNHVGQFLRYHILETPFRICGMKGRFV